MDVRQVYRGHTGEDTAGLCRAAMQTLVAKSDPRRLSINHIKSHVGRAGNEIADLLAKRCCKEAGDPDALISHPMATLGRQKQSRRWARALRGEGRR